MNHKDTLLGKMESFTAKAGGTHRYGYALKN
jgi:hypothetical protein